MFTYVCSINAYSNHSILIYSSDTAIFGSINMLHLAHLKNRKQTQAVMTMTDYAITPQKTLVSYNMTFRFRFASRRQLRRRVAHKSFLLAKKMFLNNPETITTASGILCPLVGTWSKNMIKNKKQKRRSNL